MSTDGTKPPSIAPKKSGTRGPRTASPRTQSGNRTASTTTAPPAATNGAPDPTDEDVRSAASAPAGDATSVGDRLKRVGQSVAGAARGATSRPRPDGGPATAPVAAPHGPAGGPRRVRLALAKVDPWSVMKLSFLLSVAVGIMIVVAAAVIWYTLDDQAVFTKVNSTIAEITGDPKFFDLLEYMAFDRVLSLATVIAVVDIVLLTALSTIGAFLYNIVAALVGGIHVTLTDD
jgi:hypothetical protein